VIWFFHEHRGKPIVSPALFEPIGEKFRRGVKDWARASGIPVISFKAGQRKADVMAPYLQAAAAAGRPQVAAVDWDLIETHWTDLLRTAISIRENRMSSVTLLRRLGNHSRKNRLYRAFRELGRAIRTITLLRYLSEPQLREQITQVTNRNEAFHGFAGWLMFGGKLIGHNDPDYQEKVVKFNELLANCVMYSTALDITDAANDIAAEGGPVDLDDLATISPYITHTLRRFGNWTLNLTPPDDMPNTRLDLEPRVLFAAAPA
jgi:hypothetical protein